MHRKILKYALLLSLLSLGASPLFSQAGQAIPPGSPVTDAPVNSIPIPGVQVTVNQPNTNEEVAFSLQLLLLLSIITLAPSLLILVTSFLRIAIVMDFVKRALSLQQVPPTSILMGISLFLTFFIMWPTFQTMYDNGFRPFSDGEIGTEQLYIEGIRPLRYFMFRQLQGNPENVELFMEMSGRGRPNNMTEVPTYVLIPAFILNELSKAFQIGILIYIPFIVVDIMVASVLMSMGMIMLPPVMISLPFKLILFILADGWNLIIEQLILGFG